MSVEEAPPSRRFRRRDAFFLAAFLFYWILPLAYHGLSHGARMPGSPAWMFHLTYVTCLFTKATLSWPSEYVQVLPANSQVWVTVPENAYSSMLIFGYRSRLSEIHRRGLGRQAYSELAVWLVRRYRELHPAEPPLAALRMVRAHYLTGRERPMGHWRVPPLDSIPDSERGVIFVYYPRPPAGQP